MLGGHREAEMNELAGGFYRGLRTHEVINQSLTQRIVFFWGFINNHIL